MDPLYRQYLKNKYKKKKRKKARKTRKKHPGKPSVSKKEEYKKKYQEYLKSPEWAAKRLMAFRTWGTTCQLCESSKNLQVHHRTYKNIFKELMEDLMIVCEACHKKIHGIKE